MVNKNAAWTSLGNNKYVCNGCGVAFEIPFPPVVPHEPGACKDFKIANYRNLKAVPVVSFNTDGSDVHHFDTGAVRSSDAADVRFDLISPEGWMRLAKIYAEGATKYGDNNWLKGIPLSNILNHGLRHLNLYMQGDRSEDHLAKVAWAAFAAIDMEDRPAMNDLYYAPENVQKREEAGKYKSLPPKEIGVDV